MTDTYVTPEGRSIRLINEDLLVKTEKESELVHSGLLIKPTNAHEDAYIDGVVVAVGYTTVGGKKGKPLLRVPIEGISAGDKVRFVKFLAKQHTNEHVQEHFEDGLIRIKPKDVLVVLE